jgi:hypothetical protein
VARQLAQSGKQDKTITCHDIHLPRASVKVLILITQSGKGVWCWEGGYVHLIPPHRNQVLTGEVFEKEVTKKGCTSFSNLTNQPRHSDQCLSYMLSKDLHFKQKVSEIAVFVKKISGPFVQKSSCENN